MTTTHLLIDIPAVGSGLYAPKVNAGLQVLDDSATFHPGPPASGTASGKDKSKVADAWTAAKVAGGLLQLGEASAANPYDIGDLKLELPSDGDPTVHIAGRGRLATYLKRSAGDGTNATFIGPADAASVCWSNIRDLTIQGWPATPLGTSPAAMNGLRAIHGMTGWNVDIHGFFGGLVEAGDHTLMVSVNATGNFYNRLVGYQSDTGSPRYGDHTYIDCRFDGPLRASHGIRADGSSQATQFIGGHSGFGPYGVEILARASGSTWAIDHMTCIGHEFEAQGHAWIYAVDNNARIHATILRGVAVLMHPDYKISGEPDRPLVKVAEINEFNAENCLFLPSDPVGGPLCATGAIFNVIRIYGDFHIGAGFLDSWNGRLGLPFIQGIGNNPEGIRFTDAGFRAVGGQAHPAAGGTPGLQVPVHTFAQWSSATYAIPHGYGSAPSLPAGLALNGVTDPATQEIIVLVKESTSQAEALTADADWSTAQIITTDPSNPGKVTVAANHAALAGRPIIGRPWAPATVTAGKQTLRINIP